MGLQDLVKDVQTIAVVCNQFGDTGKGKFSDFFAQNWADVIARGTGGNNAGHTVVINGNERIFHLIPAGIVYDNLGKINLLGNGMVIDLKVLGEELDSLDKEGFSYNNLMISKDAHVIMPHNIEKDRAKNQSQRKGGIGSTGRGIGPTYSDKTARFGVMIEDLYNTNSLVKKLKTAQNEYPEQTIKIDDIVEHFKPLAERIKPFVRNTYTEMHRFMRVRKKILIEGAQGLLLSIEHGTNPYVTSSDPSINGAASGVGLSAKMIDLPLGIVKFPVMTRVGGGPFPTELGKGTYKKLCRSDEYDKIFELEKYEIPFKIVDEQVVYNHKDPKILEMMNAPEHHTFIKSAGLRLAMGEYGATTGRPRRIGWTDAVAAKYAVGINGPLMILTKPDSIAEMNHFSICYGYEKDGKHSERFDRNSDYLNSVDNLLFHEYEGYSNISNVKSFDALPESLKQSIHDFEFFTNGVVKIVSVGPEAHQTIIR